MHVFQGDADIWLYLKSFYVQDCSGKSKQNKVTSLSWKPSVVITALVHGALRLTHRWADGLSSWETYVRTIESPETQSQWWLLLLFYSRDKNNQINLTLLYSIEVFIHFAFLNGEWVAWHFSLIGTAYPDKLWILTVTLQQKSLYSLDYVNISTGKLENSLYFT